jgi:hypothetical protein
VHILAAGTLPAIGYDEAEAVQMPNGDVVMIIRWDSVNEQTGQYYRTVSHDNGTTWSAVVPSLNTCNPLRADLCPSGLGAVGQPSLLALPNGNLLLEGRGNAFSDEWVTIAALSTDEGLTWTTPSEAVAIVPQTHDYYDALTLEANGTIATVQASGQGVNAALNFSALLTNGIAVPPGMNFGAGLVLSNLKVTNLTVNGDTEMQEYAGTGPVATVLNQTHTGDSLLGFTPYGNSNSVNCGTYKYTYNVFGFKCYGIVGSTTPLLFTFDPSIGLTLPAGFGVNFSTGAEITGAVGNSGLAQETTSATKTSGHLASYDANGNVVDSTYAPTSANTASTIVARDGSGNFAAAAATFTQATIQQPLVLSYTTLAATTTIAPTAAVTLLTCSTTCVIVNITPPTGCTTSGQACKLTLIPINIGITSTGAGNIELAHTFTQWLPVTAIYIPSILNWLLE